MPKPNINKEIDARLSSIYAFRKSGRYFDLPTAINEMLKSIMIKNDIAMIALDDVILPDVGSMESPVAALCCKEPDA